MKLAVLATILGSATAFTPSSFNAKSSIDSSSSLRESIGDLDVLAKKLNPVVPYFDPLGLACQFLGNYPGRDHRIHPRGRD